MDFKKIRKNKIVRILLNKYVFVGLFFVIWMLFLDTNSLLVHMELNEEINDIKKRNNYYKKELKSDKKQVKNLKDSFFLEKYARENFYMKKTNEEIFIIEFEDSLKD
jgi:cell division protein FtsB